MPEEPASDETATTPPPHRRPGWSSAVARVGRIDGRRAARRVAFVAVALAGAVAAVALFGNVGASIGPFDTTMTASPVAGGGTTVELAPLGRIDVDSHRGPVGLSVRLDQLRESDARAIASDPERLDLDEDELAADVRSGIERLAQRVALVAVLGGAGASVLVRRRWQSVVVGGLVGALAAGSAMGVAARSWEPESLAEPRYSGLLSLAPQAVGDADDVLDRFDDYQAQLAGIIENVAVLYQGADEIRSFRPDASTIRVLHVSDLHLNPQAFDLIDRIVPQFAVDVVADTGDINDWGTTFEARFVERIGDLDVPYVFVRGNHDSRATARAVAREPNAVVLDGTGREVAGLTFWGKGDPRFTPDKSDAANDDEEQAAVDEAPVVADGVRAFGPDRIDVVMVHDPAVAADLGDVVPLVLAGHRHRANLLTRGERTRLLVEGSTGGGGLRALQGDEPVPLSCSVLYFDAETGELQALDRIVIGGVNRADVRIERTVIAEPEDEQEPQPPGEDADRTSTSTTPPAEGDDGAGN